MAHLSSSDAPDLWKTYTKEREVGRGRYAKVYKANEVETKRILAVKVFDKLPSRSEDDHRRAAIRREVKLLNKVRDGPHIIVAGGARYMNNAAQNVELPMEFYAEDLSSLMKRTEDRRGLIEGFMVFAPWYNTVLMQMLKALDFLHSQKINVIHRDVKPENILFNNTDHFVLADFGHASLALPPPVGIGGSLQYMSPEMYDAKRQSTAVDIWSLGIVCIDMLNWMPKTPNSRTFDSMKNGHWCRAMHELAKELKNFWPELLKMLMINAVERPSASELYIYLEDRPGTEELSKRPTKRLIYLMIKKNLGPGTPDENIHRLLAVYLRKYGCSEEIPDRSPTRKIEVRVRKTASAPIRNLTPAPLMPASRANANSSRLRGISSIPAAKSLTESRGIMRSAVMQMPRRSKITSGPTIAATASPPTRSQEMAGPSSVRATPSAADLSGTRGLTSAATTRWLEMPRKVDQSSRGGVKPTTTQRSGAVVTRTGNQPSSEATMRTTTRASSGLTAQAPDLSQEIEDPSRTATKSPPRGSKGAAGPSREASTSPPTPSEEAARPSRGSAPSPPSVSKETAETARGSSIPPPTMFQGRAEPSSAAATSTPRVPQETAEPSNRASTSSPRVPRDRAGISSGASMSPPRVSPERLEPSSGGTPSPPTVGSRKSCRRLSADAPDWYPPGQPEDEHDLRGQGQQRQNWGRPPAPLYPSYYQAQNHPAGPPPPGFRAPPRHLPPPHPSSPPAQNYPVWTQVGVFSPGPLPPSHPMAQNIPVWSQVGIYSPTSPSYPGPEHFRPNQAQSSASRDRNRGEGQGINAQSVQPPRAAEIRPSPPQPVESQGRRAKAQDSLPPPQQAEAQGQQQQRPRILKSSPRHLEAQGQQERGSTRVILPRPVEAQNQDEDDVNNEWELPSYVRRRQLREARKDSR